MESTLGTCSILLGLFGQAHDMVELLLLEVPLKICTGFTGVESGEEGLLLLLMGFRLGLEPGIANTLCSVIYPFHFIIIINNYQLLPLSRSL